MDNDPLSYEEQQLQIILENEYKKRIEELERVNEQLNIKNNNLIESTHTCGISYYNRIDEHGKLYIREADDHIKELEKLVTRCYENTDSDEEFDSDEGYYNEYYTLSKTGMDEINEINEMTKGDLRTELFKFKRIIGSRKDYVPPYIHHYNQLVKECVELYNEIKSFKKYNKEIIKELDELKECNIYLEQQVKYLAIENKNQKTLININL